MKRFRISLFYTLNEHLNIFAESLEKAHEKAEQLAKSALESNETSEITYAITYPVTSRYRAYTQGSVKK